MLIVKMMKIVTFIMGGWGIIMSVMMRMMLVDLNVVTMMMVKMITMMMFVYVYCGNNFNNYVDGDDGFV